MRYFTGTYSILSASCSEMRWSTALFNLFGVTFNCFGHEPAPI